MRHLLIVAFILIASACSVLAIPCAVPDTGKTLWTVQPELQQVYGSAGTGATFVSILMQGYVGGIQLCGDLLSFDGRNIFMTGDLYWNNKRVVVGDKDSGGAGYRMLMIEN